MGTGMSTLHRVLKSEISNTIELLTKSFLDDPLAKYFFPDLEERQKYIPHFFEFRMKQGIRYGEVYSTSPDFEGIIIIKHSSESKSTMWRHIRCGGLGFYRALGSERIRRMMKIDTFVHERHEKFAPTPCIFLGPIAVHPDYQGQGHASKLMRPLLERFDEEKIPCYLETESESNVSLYKHYGFEIVDETTMLETSIPHWDMIRHPR